MLVLSYCGRRDQPVNQLKEVLIWIALGIPGMVLIGLVLHSLVHFETGVLVITLMILGRKLTRRGLSRQRRARACPITHSLNSLPRSVTKTCSKILLYAMSFLPGAVTQKRFATVMPVPCQIMVRTMFELPARRERTLFSIRLSKAVALANRAIGMSSTK